MANEPAPNAQDKLKAYNYPGSADDDKIIKTVETEIALHFPASYTSGLVEGAAKAPIDKHDVDKQRKDYDDKVAQAKKDHPDDVKKELAGGPAPKLDAGPAVHPTVKQDPIKTAPVAKPAGTKAAGPAPHAAAPPKPAMAAGPERIPSPPSVLVLTAAASGDMNLDKWLDGYPNKDPETKEKLTKIKEMGTIAKGFDGQVEGYVKKGDGFGESAKQALTWLGGKKEINAAFGENPYEKVHGGLGVIMQGISRFQNVVSIVGNVAGKLGLVLTIVGLLAMILPPIGALIESIARILNIVGIICDAIGLVLSGILVGLNGVVLAQQIGKGGSNEEKAATADMMMSEANSAGGHILSLAMSYGPGFMKGVKGASKGVVGALFNKYKTMVGTFITKELGPVANWAKNIGYKMGIGLEKTEGPGVMSKLWKSPETALSHIRNNSVVAKFNTSFVAKGATKAAAYLDNVKWANSVEGFGEKMGAKFGGLGEGTAMAKRAEGEYQKAVARDIASAGQNAGKDAANRESASVQRDIETAHTNAGSTYDKAISGDRFDEGLAAKSEDYAKEADALEAGKKDAVTKAGSKGAADARTDRKNAIHEEHEKATGNSQEDRDNEEFKKDPAKFLDETKAQEAKVGAERAKLKQEMADPAITKERKEHLQLESDLLLHELDERRLVPLKASGGESLEHLWDAKVLAQETASAAQLNNEKGEQAEQSAKWIEKDEGKLGREDLEKAEQHHLIAEWSEAATITPTAASQAAAMLEGLDEDLEHEGPDAGGDEPADLPGEGAGSEGGPPGGEPDAQPDAAPAMTGGEPGGGAGGGGGSGQEAPAPAPAAATTPAAPTPAAGARAPGADLPPLVYWPALAGPGGEFAKAATDLTRMKQYAYAFQKEQIKAKQKAVEAFQAFISADEYSALQKQQADAHAVAAQAPLNEAKTAGGAADKGSSKADEGTGQQDKSKGSAENKTGNVPDVGEKPGLLHPIKRIWWYMKRWVAEKAAAVFGWIQEKIASLVLQGICGVSMGQLKGYTAALHRRMAFAQGVGVKGGEQAKGAGEKANKNKAITTQYAQDAMNDAAECDKNIEDAGQFMKNVEQTEAQVAAEQARATAFIANLKSSVDTEKAALAAEKEKKKADMLKQATGPVASTPAPAGTAAPMVAPVPVPAPASRQPAGPKKPKKVSAAAVTRIQNAARYVANQAGVVAEQLTTSKQQQRDKLKAAVAALPKAKRKIAEHPAAITADGLLASVTSHIATIRTGMDQLTKANPATAEVVHSDASKILSGATALDDIALHSSEDLNAAFASAYKQYTGKAA